MRRESPANESVYLLAIQAVNDAPKRYYADDEADSLFKVVEIHRIDRPLEGALGQMLDGLFAGNTRFAASNLDGFSDCLVLRRVMSCHGRQPDSDYNRQDDTSEGRGQDETAKIDQKPGRRSEYGSGEAPDDLCRNQSFRPCTFSLDLSCPLPHLWNLHHTHVAEQLAVVRTLLIHALVLVVARLHAASALETEVDTALRTAVCVRVHRHAASRALGAIAPPSVFALLICHHGLLRARAGSFPAQPPHVAIYKLCIFNL